MKKKRTKQDIQKARHSLGDEENGKASKDQRELVKAGELFRMIFQRSPVATALEKLSGRILLDVNSCFEDLFGYKRAELVGKSVADFDIWVDVEERRHCFQVLKEKQKLRDWEFLFKTKTGKTGYGTLFAEIIKQRAEKYVLIEILDITDRKKAEQQIADALNYIETIFRTSPVGIITYRESGEAIAANRAAAMIVGTSIEKLLGQNFKELETWEKSGLREAADAAFATGEERNIEVHGTSSFGKETWFAARFVVFIHQRRKELLVLLSDITERKQAEGTLQESEERFSKAFKISPYAYIIANMDDGRIIEVNDAFTAISGFTREEALASSTLNLKIWLQEEDRQRMVATLRDGRAVTNFETRLRGKKGDIKTVLLFAQVILLGQRPYILSIVEDITERKRSQEVIAAEKERLAVTLRSIGDAVIATDIQGNIVLMNKIAETLTGWRSDQAEGKPLSEVFKVINEITREHLVDPVKKVLESGEIIELANHTLLISRDGSERVIADSGAPIKDANGRIIGVVLVFRDITEKQKFLEAIQRTSKLDSLGVLAGGIAHDFNNLLSIIYGNLQLMESASIDKEAAGYLASCLNTMQRARGITTQLLTFAKGGAPVKKTGRLTPFIIDTVKFASSGSKCLCAFDIEDGLWTLDYDENQMGQVIDNIVINAINAMPDVGKLEVAAQNVVLRAGEHQNLKPGDYIKISFKDYGIGMPAKVLSRIFEPYFTTKETGRGLGLASAHSIVLNHEGSIDVESEPGEGTTFHIYLPASRKPLKEEEPDSVVLLKGSGKILVMDDEAVLLDMLIKMLNLSGYSAVGARDGNEALKLLEDSINKREPFRAIILDLTVPGGMGGEDTVVKIREFAPDIPVFISSGYSEDPIMQNPEKYGFSGCLIKPYKSEALLKMLSKKL